MNIYLELRNKSASVLWPSNINRKHTSNETEGRYDLVHENYTKSQSLKGQTIPTCFYAVRYTVTICIDVLVLHCNLSKFTHQRNDKTEYICGYAIMYFSNGRCFFFFLNTSTPTFMETAIKNTRLQWKLIKSHLSDGGA